MKTVRVKIDVGRPESFPIGRVDTERLDRSTQADLELQKKADDLQALRDAGDFAREVRRRLGLTQQEFASSINVSLETIRNWEQGRRRPTGAAKALLKVLYKLPEACLAALE